MFVELVNKMSWTETRLEAMLEEMENDEEDGGKVDQNHAWLETFLEVHWRVPETANVECLAIAKVPAVPSSLI